MSDLGVMVAWLGTDDARAAARHDLRRAGLDAYEPDDLLHDVAVRLLRAELPACVEHPIAYARRSVQRRATDLLRGDRVRDRLAATPRIEDDDAGPGGTGPLADPGAADPGEVAAAAAVEDAIRRGLHAALAGAAAKAWTVAAALNTLTLRVHPDVQLPVGAPRPDGDDQDRADRWAALWLAGEAGVFPDPAGGRPDGAAVRKSRSRKLQEVEQLLRSVAAAILLDAADDEATDADG